MSVICSFTFLFLLWNENGKRERGKQDEVIIGVNDKQDEAKGGVLKGGNLYSWKNVFIFDLDEGTFNVPLLSILLSENIYSRRTFTLGEYLPSENFYSRRTLLSENIYSRRSFTLGELYSRRTFTLGEHLTLFLKY